MLSNIPRLTNKKMVENGKNGYFELAMTENKQHLDKNEVPFSRFLSNTSA